MSEEDTCNNCRNKQHCEETGTNVDDIIKYQGKCIDYERIIEEDEE